ncbi:phage tail protein [Paenibacillus sp. YYML68]|uniref:phage tail protein n=1 Tax=Paenibacillus sp. YYML68 TaxID=2909250 RepID=UPI0024920CEA|nr:hypothetical protein [Paenibacillus sp. YYML68]
MTLTNSQLPAHTHAAVTTGHNLQVTGMQVKLPASSNPSGGDTNVPGPLASPAAVYDGNGSPVNAYTTGPTDTYMKEAVVTGGTLSGAFTTTVGLAGGSIPVDIRQPFQAVNYIICVEGIFPSRAN